MSAATSGKLRVLFLCTGNSARSQMAEGWARRLKADFIESHSAGVDPRGPSRRAVRVMAEAGVDISDQRSKHVDELAGIDFDYVVTLCDHARQSCPVFPKKTKVVHFGFADPAAATGRPEEILATYRTVRDQIRDFVQTLPESLAPPPE